MGLVCKLCLSVCDIYSLICHMWSGHTAISTMLIIKSLIIFTISSVWCNTIIKCYNLYMQVHTAVHTHLHCSICYIHNTFAYSVLIACSVSDNVVWRQWLVLCLKQINTPRQAFILNVTQCEYTNGFNYTYTFRLPTWSI